MTTTDATRELFAWFTKNDSFTLSNKGGNDDFKKIIKITEKPESDTAAIKSGLAELETINLISKVESKESTTWVLKKHIDSYEQNVQIGYEVALQVAEVINSFCQLIENKTDECNPTSIREKDIKNICLIAVHFAGQIEKLSKTEE